MIGDTPKRFTQLSSIRGRLMLAFSALLGLLLGLSVMASYRLAALGASMHEFVYQPARLVLLAERANQQSQYAAIQLLRLLQTPEKNQRIPLYAKMDAAMTTSKAAIADLTQVDNRANPQAHNAQVTELLRRYGVLFQETVELIEIEGLTQARAHFERHTDAALNELLDETLRLTARQQALMNLEVERFEQSANNTRLQIVAITTGALILGALLALLISRSIVMPIGKAVAMAETIAAGHYNDRIPRARGPEMQVLLRALALMRNNIVLREERISSLAYVDSLTGLPNRAHFMEALATASAGEHGALVILNINRFAPINNALGHAVGDRILGEIGARLRACVATPHLVARLGGDEFVMLYEGSDRSASAGHIQIILDALRRPMCLDGQQLDISASLGIVFYPDDGNNPTALLRRADLAIKAAKRQHDSYVYAAELEDVVQHEQLTLLGEMRNALARNEFVIHYQPKLHLADARISGVEALLRWKHPLRGLIAPDLFIPFAEQTGFIREITPWLIREVVGHAAQWRRDGVKLVASFNISALDLLNPALIDGLQQLLMQTSLPGEMLCLEITESALINHPERAHTHLLALARLGVKLSIDDYGAGHASLAYVKTLPVHELKIDRSFITQVDQQRKSAAIVRSTIVLCRELGLSVVAEGVETASELEWLQVNHCDLVQGFGIGRPMPVHELYDWLAITHAGPTGTEAGRPAIPVESDSMTV